jgi:hypothetical protein
MRLHVLSYSRTDDAWYRTEVIGEVVELKKFPDEVFAVHANPFGNRNSQEPFFCVTHVETGARFAGGDSIEFAIAMAHRTAKAKRPDELVAALRRAREVARDTATSPNVVRQAFAMRSGQIAETNALALNPVCNIECNGEVV